ncbi:MAG TPA: ABC transporter permease [Longimicrobiales bacterium]|nr:ABC transporter permease [Longimicrobiales bacterium]
MDLWHDVRYALRRLLEARGFTLAALAALSLAIGANTTVFTFVNAVLLRGLPFDEGERIVAIWSENAQGEQIGGLSHPDYADLRDELRTLEGLAIAMGASVNLSDDETAPERLQGAYVSAGLFGLLREEPILGRRFSDQDDLPGAEPVMVISESLWRTRYASDRGVLGTTARVNSLPATIVGVMPARMRFPENVDVWIPQGNLPVETGTADRGNHAFQAFGRLAPGVSLEQAREELRAVGARLAEAHPETNAEVLLDLEPYDERVNGSEIRTIFLSLMGAVAFVLLIACANVANLLLAKAAEREREIAVRVSLGATRGRIVRQLLVESVLLAVAAGVVGLALSILGIRWFDSATQNVGKPYWMVFSMDPVVFGFMAAVCLGTALAFGLAPALQVSRTDVNEVLKEGTRGGSGGVRARRWASFLIVNEVILTIVLLSGAGFMMRSFMNLYTLEVGVETEGLLTARIYLPLTKYPDPAGQMRVHQALLDRLEGLPSLPAVTLATAPPLDGGARGPVELDGRAAEDGETPPLAIWLAVSDRYFETLGLEPVQGRVFDRADGAPGSEAVVVNERFVDVHLGGGDPLGRRVRIGAAPGTGPAEGWMSVVGVVPDVRQATNAEPDPVAYVPLRARPTRTPTLLARAAGDQASVVAALRGAMQAVEPDVPLYDVMSLDERLALERWPFRVFGILFGVFAAVALTLSAVGMYSVTANSVVQRTREFGIRTSLGAEPRTISWLALRRVLVHLGIALPVGLAGAYGVGRLLQSLLFGTEAGDPVTLAAIVLVMVSVALLACVAPARRAGRIDPMVALRVE